MFTLLQQILDLFIFRDSQLACNDVDCFVFFFFLSNCRRRLKLINSSVSVFVPLDVE